MAWVVDTSVLIDILEDDPSFGEASARFLDSHLTDGLVVCPVTYAELAPAFRGNLTLQDEFLDGIGVDCREDWVWQDTLKAHAAWHAHVQRRRAGQAARRPLADILIGSFAVRFQGLITRNPDDFRTAFPSLELQVPAVPEDDRKPPETEAGPEEAEEDPLSGATKATEDAADTEVAPGAEEERGPAQGDPGKEP